MSKISRTCSKNLLAVDYMPEGDPISSVLDGTAPKALRLIVARGLLPIPPSKMLDALVCLLKDGDPEVASKANLTLSAWTETEICAILKQRDCSPQLLSHFSSREASNDVLEAVILNPKTPGSAIAKVASNVSAALIELIMINRIRLLEFPDILENIKNNPSCPPQVQGTIQEIEAEFFSKKESTPSISIPSAAPESDPDILETQDVEDIPEDLSLEGLPLDPSEREAAIFQRLSKMTPTQKIKHAMFGTREVRAILIRDTNKIVAKSVLRSPKLTESEIGAIAAMRNVSEDVLRDIGNSRTMTQSYSVVQNLVNNPKTPPQVSQRMLLRLGTRDLQLISRNRGVPESVRRGAQRALANRSATSS
jgi:hypothetical protein